MHFLRIFSNCPKLSKPASLILKIGLPVVSSVFAYILIYTFNCPTNERAWVIGSIYAMLEYALMSFLVLFCGALIFDIIFKKCFNEAPPHR